MEKNLLAPVKNKDHSKRLAREKTVNPAREKQFYLKPSKERIKFVAAIKSKVE